MAIDYLDPRTLKEYSDLFIASSPIDKYNTPITASSEYWKGMEEVLNGADVEILTGGYEMFMDDVVEFVEKMRKYNKGVEIRVVEQEVHVQAVVDRGLGMKMAESERVVRKWVFARC